MFKHLIIWSCSFDFLFSDIHTGEVVLDLEVYLPGQFQGATMVLEDHRMVMEKVEVLSIIQKVGLLRNYFAFWDSYHYLSLILVPNRNKYIARSAIYKEEKVTYPIQGKNPNHINAYLVFAYWFLKIRIKLKLRSLLTYLSQCDPQLHQCFFSCLHLPRIDWRSSLPDTIVLWPTEVSWGL